MVLYPNRLSTKQHTSGITPVPVYYTSKVDDTVEHAIRNNMLSFDKKNTNVAMGRQLSKEVCLFATEFANSLDLLPKNFTSFLNDKEVKKLFGRMPLLDILDFYAGLKNKDNCTYISELSPERRAFACFMLLATVNENFIRVMRLAEAGVEFEAGAHLRYSINFQCRVLDADIRSLYYLCLISNQRVEQIDAIGRKIDSALLEFKRVYEKVEKQSLTQPTVSTKLAHDIAHATTALLKVAMYDNINLDSETCLTIIKLARQVCGTLRTFETLLGLPDFLNSSVSGFQAYLYMDYAADSRGNLYFSLNCEMAINNSKKSAMLIQTDSHTKKITLTPNSQIGLSDSTYNKLTLIVKLLEHCFGAEHIGHSKEFISILAAVCITRYVLECDEGFDDISEVDIEQLFKTLFAIGTISSVDVSTLIMSNISNILNANLGIENAYNFIKENSLTRSGMSYPLIIFENQPDVKVNEDLLFNRMYKALKVNDTSLYTLSVETYNKLQDDETLSLALADNIKLKDKPIFEENPYISMIVNSLFNFETFLAESDYEYNVFDTYDLGMAKVYEKYPDYVNFFKTFYVFYPVGVLAQLSNDTQLPLDIIEGRTIFDIEQIVKKFKRHQNQELRRKEEEERRKQLEAKAREREAERERQRELEAQRLAEQKRIEEAEKLKQLELTEANKIMEELNKKAWAGFTVPQQQAAYVRYLQEGNDPLAAANLVKEEFIRRQEEEEALLAQWEQEEADKLAQKQLAEEEEEQRRKEEEQRRKEEELKAHKALCDKADKQYEDMRAGRAIFPNILLSEEEQKTAPLLNIYEVAKLFPDMTTAQKLMKKVYDAPCDALAVDIISEELLRLNEIKSSQVIDPIDKEVMTSAKALANKHGVPYDRFAKLVELGMPVEQALIIPNERLAVLAGLYKADKIVHDRKGRYIVCKGAYIIPVTYKELRDLYIKHKKRKGDGNE